MDKASLQSLWKLRRVCVTRLSMPEYLGRKLNTDNWISSGSAPEPLDVLSARQLTRSARTSLPPPKARSPIKTNLNSSPQRHPSLVPQSSARRSLGSPIRAKSVASVRRRLDFNDDVPRPSIEISPRKFRISSGSDEENRPPEVVDIEVSPVQEPLDEQKSQVNGYAEDTYLPVIEDDSVQILHGGDVTEAAVNGETELPEHPVESTPANAAKAKGKSTIFIDSTPATSESVKSKRGGHPENAPQTQGVEQTTHDDSYVDPALLSISDDTMAGALPPDDDSEIPIVLSPRSKKTKLNVLRDESEEPEEARPAKRARSSSVQRQPPKRKPGPKGKKNTAKAPKERDANARPAARQRSATKELLDDEGNPKPRGARAGSKPRSLQILRQGTPLEEDSTTKTRSGRMSIQPVAWWCGERVNRDWDGSIKDIIRAESHNLTPKPKRKGGRKPKRKVLEDIEEEQEEEEDLEDWEEEGGILTGLVRAWDSEYNMTIEDDDVEMGMHCFLLFTCFRDNANISVEIAFAANSIQTRDVMGSSFSYAKILTLPFFGAGIVDIPAGGFKRAKNSRKMQMVFFLHTGKVLVTVGDLEFSISKGGVWQVPRGESYTSFSTVRESRVRITHNSFSSRYFLFQHCPCSEVSSRHAQTPLGRVGEHPHIIHLSPRVRFLVLRFQLPLVRRSSV